MPSSNEGQTLPLLVAVGGFGQASAKRDQRPRQAVGEFRKEQRDAKQSQKRDRDVASIFIGLHRPAAADRRQRRDDREGQAHAKQHRQAAAKERLVGAGEHERQHRQDAGAGDGQHPADIG